MQPSDTVQLETLIAAVATGDRQAFEQLYLRTAPKLLGVVLRILKERALAEDVVQDAYLRVWRSAGSYTAASGRPMTWLITIARNRAIDVLRQRRGLSVSQDEDGRDLIAQVAGPRDEEARLIAADRLGLCLGQLDEVQRRCLLDAYHEGYSREELAVRYERPVNTIKTWLHRSTMSLRACLADT